MVDDEKCFAFQKGEKNNSCAILKDGDCKNCSFWKTKQEYEEDLEEYPPDMSKFVDKPRTQKKKKWWE